jgi:hypothetical protein
LSLYLVICFYLLPAIAAILKTRKRKLAQVSTSVDSGLAVNTNFSSFTKVSLDNINTKLNLLSASTSNLNAAANMNKNLGIYLSVELPAIYSFEISTFKQVQISYFLYA